MTEKIIIDGVDVSRCIHLYSAWPGSLEPNSCDMYTEDDPFADLPSYLCRCHKNCYYKQRQHAIARLQAVVKQNKSLQTEVKNLTELLEIAKEAPICFQCKEEPCIRKEKEKLEQECERMRGVLNEIRSYELKQLDVDLDEYEICRREIEYSKIITYCELGLGET